MKEKGGRREKYRVGQRKKGRDRGREREDKAERERNKHREPETNNLQIGTYGYDYLACASLADATDEELAASHFLLRVGRAGCQLAAHTSVADDIGIHLVHGL